MRRPSRARCPSCRRSSRCPSRRATCRAASRSPRSRCTSAAPTATSPSASWGSPRFARSAGGRRVARARSMWARGACRARGPTRSRSRRACSALPVRDDDRARIEAFTSSFEGSLLAAEVAATGDALREQPFAFTVDGVVFRGVLDVLVRRPDGSMLVIDYKTTRLGDRSPDELVAEEYELQRQAYALALLGGGATLGRRRVRVPRAPGYGLARLVPARRTSRRCARPSRPRSSGCAPRASRRVPRRVSAATAGRSTASARGRGSGERAARRRRRAAADVDRAAPAAPRLPRRGHRADVPHAVGAAGRDGALGAVHRRAGEPGDAGAVRARTRRPRRSPSPIRPSSRGRSTRPATTTRRRARCAAPAS